jgi:tRNA-specific 2-thiouridylase
VIDRFAESYLAGETPIPCVDCNRSVKFRDLLETARELGADALATGHYVASRAGEGGRRELVRAADPSRDQSYFLYATTPEQLALLRFPLGDLPKEETRRLAREFGLAVADKPDSQDICFVPQGRYGDVLEKLRPMRRGRARSCISTDACSAGIPASRTSPSASAAGSVSPMPTRSTCSGSIPPGRA